MIKQIFTLPSKTEFSEPYVRIRSQFLAYGPNNDFLRFYEMDDGTLFSVMGDLAVLDANEDACLSEFCLFVSMSYEICQIHTTVSAAKNIEQFLKCRVERRQILRKNAHFDVFRTAQPVPIQPTYMLLKGIFGEDLPPFDTWYVDVSHRMRHGCLHLVGFEKQNRTISSAMTVAETENEWIIGAVATSEDCQHQGLGSGCVLTLAKMGIEAKKIVLISPKNEYADRMYRSIGFEDFGEWALCKLS